MHEGDGVIEAVVAEEVEAGRQVDGGELVGVRLEISVTSVT